MDMPKFTIANIHALGLQQMQKPLLFEKTIALKLNFQQKLVESATRLEAETLLQNRIALSLKDKLFDIGREYIRLYAPLDDQTIYCIAMCIGTILKELDNGNAAYVTEEGILDIMNAL